LGRKEKQRGENEKGVGYEVVRDHRWRKRIRQKSKG